MPTSTNKATKGSTGLDENELLAWYLSLTDAEEACGIELDETLPMDRERFVVCDTNGEKLTDVMKARALGEEDTPDKANYMQMAETLYAMASSGRLFIYGVGERFPRRVLVENNMAVITEPMDQLTMPKPLSGWHWFANKITGGWAYGAEQQAYENAMRDYQQHSSRYWPDDKLPASFDRGEAVADEAQRRQRAVEHAKFEAFLNSNPSLDAMEAFAIGYNDTISPEDMVKLTEMMQAVSASPDEKQQEEPYDLETFLKNNPSLDAMKAFAIGYNDTMSPEDMAKLTEMIQAASPTSDFSVVEDPSDNTEFTNKQMLIDKVGMCNDPQQLQNVLDGKDPIDLTPSDRAFLSHRIRQLNTIAELEKNLPEKQVQGELVPKGTGFCLTGVTQPEAQRTGNGCWSVSLQTQLAFRGIYLDQATIRAVRPSNQNNYNYEITEADRNQDTTQTITDYANLVHRLLPNTAVNSVTLSSDYITEKDDRASLLRDTVMLAMQKHHSPVSIVYGVHYRTIFGMDENYIYVKNPLNPNPDHCEAISIREVAEKQTVQLTWLQDLTPGLDGSTPMLGRYSALSGNAYYGGKLVFNEMDLADGAQTLCCPTDYQSLSGKNIRIESQLPDRLTYRRHSGAQPDSFSINLDALSDYETQIAPLAQKNDAYKQLHEALKDMLENQTQTTHENLYALAKTYQNAYRVSIQELKNAPGDKDCEAARELLMSQTSKIQGCLRSYLNFQNQKLIGDPGKSYLDSAQWTNMEKGMVSALHDQIVCSSTPLEDSRWLEQLSPGKNGRVHSIRTFCKQPEVEKMMQNFKKTCEMEFARDFLGERKTVQIKAAIRGGNILPLVEEYKSAREQIKSAEKSKPKSKEKGTSTTKTVSKHSRGN